MNKKELNQLNENKCSISTRTCSLFSPLLFIFNINFGKNIIETLSLFLVKDNLSLYFSVIVAKQYFLYKIQISISTWIQYSAHAVGVSSCIVYTWLIDIYYTCIMETE